MHISAWKFSLCVINDHSFIHSFTYIPTHVWCAPLVLMRSCQVLKQDQKHWSQAGSYHLNDWQTHPGLCVIIPHWCWCDSVQYFLLLRSCQVPADKSHSWIHRLKSCWRNGTKCNSNSPSSWLCEEPWLWHFLGTVRPADHVKTTLICGSSGTL